MNLKELKQYLKDISTLEYQLYTYQKIEQLYKKQLNKLEKERSTVFLNEDEDYMQRKFHHTSQVVPAPEVKPRYLGERKNRRGQTVFVYGFRGAQDMFRKIPERWWDEELIDFEKREHNRYIFKHLLTWLPNLFLGCIVCYLLKNLIPLTLFLLLAIILSYRIGNENKREYLPGDAYYDKFMQIYKEKYYHDLDEKERIYTPQIEQLTADYENFIKASLTSTNALLEQLYKKDIIHQKYRNFIAVTQMHDYLDIERCTELTGLNGAYNIYEQELRDEVLLTDLDASIYQLEKYKDVMYTFVSLLKQSDTVIANVASDLNKNTHKTIDSISKLYNTLHVEIVQRYQL